MKTYHPSSESQQRESNKFEIIATGGGGGGGGNVFPITRLSETFFIMHELNSAHARS